MSLVNFSKNNSKKRKNLLFSGAFLSMPFPGLDSLVIYFAILKPAFVKLLSAKSDSLFYHKSEIKSISTKSSASNDLIQSFLFSFIIAFGLLFHRFFVGFDHFFANVTVTARILLSVANISDITSAT